MFGKNILHYEILEKLGEGGMGIVYLAEDTKLERQVAIKFLPHHIAANSDERKRFEIEAKAAAALNQSNIATIHAIEETEDEIFLVMEYISGRHLKDYINSKPLPLDEAVDIATQIAQGLQAAHEKGIVHRDVKSSNIMIMQDGQVKIMDFGLAKVRGSDQLTKIGTTVGTTAYMSPEQAKGANVDQRSDIWSLGIVLYEMITGQVPFRDDYEQAIIYSILNEEPEEIGEIDQRVQMIIKKSLAKNPDERYQSAAEILTDLLNMEENSGKSKIVIKRSKTPWLLGAGIVTLILVVIYFLIPFSQPEIEKKEIKTIAVMPFLDISPNKDQEYLSDGLSGELINILSKNSSLRVIARTSSFSFKGKDVDIKTIAQTLNVKNLLEGSIQKSGDRLRIMASLIDGENNATLWSETYDGKMDNIFDLQDSISNSVAKALNITLLGKENSPKQWKTDPDVYNAYLLGKHFYSLYTRKDLEKAEEYFNKALAIDSSYAPAWVQLSLVHSIQADYGVVPVEDGYGKARREVQRALELDSNYVPAFSRMGSIKRMYDWDWTGADKYFKKALGLEPEYTGALSGAASLAATFGNFDKAISLTNRLIEFEPVRAGLYYNLSYYKMCAGKYEESIEAVEKCQELSPGAPGIHMLISFNYLEMDQLDSAFTQANLETRPFLKSFILAMVYFAMGKTKDADDTLTDIIKEYQNTSAYQIAQIYGFRGESDKAFEWLERAYDQRDGGLPSVKDDPTFKNIENDPRYTAFLKKMKLPL